MKRALITLSLFGLCTLLPAQSSVDPILMQALAPSPMMRNLRELCDRIGGRVTGSAAHQRALRWGLAGFRDGGVEARLESFTMPARWEAGTASIEVLGPGAFKPRVTPWGWSINAHGTFPLIDGGSGSAEELKALGPRAKGAFILIQTPLIRTEADLSKEYLSTVTYIPVARELGVAGILSISSRAMGILYRHIERGDGRLSTLPELIVAREDGLRLARELDAGQDLSIKVSTDNQVGGPFETQNVVAEIPGSDLRQEIVLVGAHVDSWDLGTGAVDNGCNAAMVVELARIIHASGLKPRRTLRFVLFSGESIGFLGSRAYTERHADEMERHRAVLICHTGASRVRGYVTGGLREWIPILREALAPLGDSAPQAHDPGAFMGLDNFDFLLQGVPNLVADHEWKDLLPHFQTETDTLDKVDPRDLRDKTLETAVLLWGLANAERLPARRTRPQIEAILKATQMDEDMKTFGLWEEWASGKRGRK